MTDKQRLIAWCLTVGLFMYLFYTIINTAMPDLTSDQTALGIAPVVEEFFKFVIIRSGLVPLYVGLGFTLVEFLGKGVSFNPFFGVFELKDLVLSVHWLTVLLYQRFGAKWKVLPFAMLTHFFWNLLASWRPPDDVVPAVALLVISAFVLWTLRNKEANSASLKDYRIGRFFKRVFRKTKEA